MSAELLDRLQEDKLQGLEQLIDDYQAVAGARAAADSAAAIADFFIDEGIGLRQSSMRLWDHHWGAALAGKITNLKERGAKLQSLLERTGRLLARQVAAARSHAEASSQEVARLAQLEEQVKAFPQWIEECMARWELLETPRKPLQRDRIAAAQAAFAEGTCEDIGDIVARLRGGGPLVQE
jgi:hypothetical protein